MVKRKIIAERGTRHIIGTQQISIKYHVNIACECAPSEVIVSLKVFDVWKALDQRLHVASVVNRYDCYHCRSIMGIVILRSFDTHVSHALVCRAPPWYRGVGRANGSLYPARNPGPKQPVPRLLRWNCAPCQGQ